ncbi:DUF4159 domain-containing protein, partial [Pedobacter borealis]|uniref:DUF4159 domain-containing protein n=1 Tax=Pedobacter borealis TaxID=475254 RepID=UPI000562B738
QIIIELRLFNCRTIGFACCNFAKCQGIHFVEIIKALLNIARSCSLLVSNSYRKRRIGVLYSNKDYGCEWDYDFRNKRFLAEDNTKFGVNIILYAMGINS